MALHPWENSFCLVFTVVTVLFFSCMNTTNCSIFSNASCDRFAVSVPSSKKADITVGNVVHVFQAFSFPFQPKNETVSQPVRAWKAEKALDLSATRLEAIAWAAMYLKCFPVPNATHNSSTFIYSTTQIASTKSVSAVRIIIFFCSMNKYLCVGFFVGASTHMVQVYFCGWWDHAVTASGDEYCAWNFSIFNFFKKKERKKVTLFSPFFKKLFQVEGNGAKGNTLRCWPWPRLLLVPAFKLSVK